MIKKYLLLKAMDQIIRSLNNERSYYNTWCYYVPEDAEDDDFEMWAADDKTFDNISKAFIAIIQEDGADGFFVDRELYGV
jgi:hypothetical protein